MLRRGIHPGEADHLDLSLVAQLVGSHDAEGAAAEDAPTGTLRREPDGEEVLVLAANASSDDIIEARMRYSAGQGPRPVVGYVSPGAQEITARIGGVTA